MLFLSSIVENKVSVQSHAAEERMKLVTLHTDILCAMECYHNRETNSAVYIIAVFILRRRYTLDDFKYDVRRNVVYVTDDVINCPSEGVGPLLCLGGSIPAPAP